MYSGITQGLFIVTQVDKESGLINYRVKLNSALIEGLKLGASVNIDGVCQTVTDIHQDQISFTAMAETLKLTTLKDLFPGRKVSVERSLRWGDEVGGHPMAGHVFGTATIDQILKTENNVTLTLKCPKEWMKFILLKGFIAVDGSSLTVAETDSNGFFKVHLIPETIRLTHLGTKQIGEQVNIELDHLTQTIVTTIEQILCERKNWSQSVDC